jgi:hypothetical protein
MNIKTAFIKRSEQDQSGERLSAELQHLLFSENEKIFSLLSVVPIQNSGQTVGLIVALKGKAPK